MEAHPWLVTQVRGGTHFYRVVTSSVDRAVRKAQASGAGALGAERHLRGWGLGPGGIAGSSKEHLQ